MQPLRGIGLKIGSVLVFIVMSALVKAISDEVPVGQIAFFRSFFAIPVLLIWLYARHELRSGFGTSNYLGHFWRGLTGTASMVFSFAAVGFLPLPEATALNYAAPLLVVVFASMFLGEKVGAWRLGAVTLGLTGVLIVLFPNLSIGANASHTQLLGATLALSGAICAALAQIMVRKLIDTERTATIVFWFSVNSALLALISVPFGWVMPEPMTLLMLLMIGILGGVGQIFLTSCYRHADASVIAPFEYASMLFALLIGWFVFGDMPTVTMLAGAALVVAAGIIIILRERALGLERARQRKATPPPNG